MDAIPFAHQTHPRYSLITNYEKTLGHYFTTRLRLSNMHPLLWDHALLIWMVVGAES